MKDDLKFWSGLLGEWSWHLLRLRNKEETDFLLVAASDFVSFLSWKFDENGIKYYFVTNTKEIDKIISLLDENTDFDLNYLKQKSQKIPVD